MKKKVLIIGAGPGGCAAAVAFAQIGCNVVVVEKFTSISTRGSGILLYSNALKSVDNLGILDKVIEMGHSMDGTTLFYDDTSTLLGSTVVPSVDPKYSPFVGIDRRGFLGILYNRAIDLGVEFHFGHCVSEIIHEDETVSVSCENGKTFEHADLLIAADGLNSSTRKLFWPNSEPRYSGFGLFHSTHKLHPDVSEKITVIMPNKRVGITPISKTEMYIWASTPQPNKVYIDPEDQPKAMHDEFKNLSGFLKEIIDELITDDIYVHYTSVDEVSINKTWHHKRCALLGDSAHASTPFMAQGGAMAMQDACTLSKLLSENDSNLDSVLQEYAKLRIPVVEQVQQMSKAAGMSYLNPTIDLEKTQNFRNQFYLNKDNFN